jgi:hypothetical protein
MIPRFLSDFLAAEFPEVMKQQRIRLDEKVLIVENFFDHRRLRIYWQSLYPLAAPGETAVSDR